MIYPIDTNEIDSSVEFYEEVNPLLQEAKNYLLEHQWCKEIYRGWLFINVGYALCIFLFDINNIQSKEDNLTWVVVGDFPPMYLDTYYVETTKEVIEVYIELASEWIDKAEKGDSLEECYPLDVKVNEESISLLKRKVNLLQSKILNNIEEIDFKVVLNKT